MLELDHACPDQNCNNFVEQLLLCSFVLICTVFCHISKHVQFASNVPCKLATRTRYSGDQVDKVFHLSTAVIMCKSLCLLAILSDVVVACGLYTKQGRNPFKPTVMP